MCWKSTWSLLFLVWENWQPMFPQYPVTTADFLPLVPPALSQSLFRAPGVLGFFRKIGSKNCGVLVVFLDLYHQFRTFTKILPRRSLKIPSNIPYIRYLSKNARASTLKDKIILLDVACAAMSFFLPSSGLASPPNGLHLSTISVNSSVLCNSDHVVDVYFILLTTKKLGSDDQETWRRHKQSDWQSHDFKMQTWVKAVITLADTSLSLKTTTRKTKRKASNPTQYSLVDPMFSLKLN